MEQKFKIKVFVSQRKQKWSISNSVPSNSNFFFINISFFFPFWHSFLFQRKAFISLLFLIKNSSILLKLFFFIPFYINLILTYKDQHLLSSHFLFSVRVVMYHSKNILLIWISLDHANAWHLEGSSPVHPG